MSFPRNRHEMLRASYKFLSAKACPKCDQRVEWWATTNGKKVLFDAMPTDNSRSEKHLCPDPEDRSRTTPPPAAPVVNDVKAIDREITALRTKLKARIVVVLTDEHEHVAYRNGIPGEDLRHELITVGNNVRAAIQKEVL